MCFSYAEAICSYVTSPEWMSEKSVMFVDLKRFAQSFERIKNKHFWTITSIQRTVLPGVKAYPLQEGAGGYEKEHEINVKKTDVQSLRD